MEILDKNHSKDLLLEQKSLSWQIINILVIALILGVSFVIWSKFIFALIFKSAFLTLYQSSYNLRTIIYFVSLIPGLYFGISYVVSSSEVDSERAKKISLWLWFIYLLEPILGLIKVAISKQGYLNCLVGFTLSVFVYLFSVYLLSRTSSLKESIFVKLGILKLVIIAIFLDLVIIILIYFSIFNLVINNNKLILNYLPQSSKTQIEAQNNKLQDLKKNNDITDKLKIVKGEEVVSTLKSMSYQFNHRYPNDLASDKFIQMSEKINQTMTAGLGSNKEDSALELSNFSYQSSDEGQSFKLCVELSSGQKCWEDKKLHYTDNNYQFEFYYPNTQIMIPRDQAEGYSVWDNSTYKPEFSSTSSPEFPLYSFFVNKIEENQEKYFENYYHMNKEMYDKTVSSFIRSGQFKNIDFYKFGGQDVSNGITYSFINYVAIKDNKAYTFIALNGYDLESILSSFYFIKPFVNNF